MPRTDRRSVQPDRDPDRGESVDLRAEIAATIIAGWDAVAADTRLRGAVA